MQSVLHRGGRNLLRYALFWVCASLPLVASATDIANAVSHDGERMADGGYFEVGASLSGASRFDVRQPDNNAFQPSLMISGVYQYQGWFAEMVHQSQDGINLGYNFWNSQDWSLDLIFANFQTLWELGDDVDLSAYDEAQRDDYLTTRGHTFLGAGLRATRYWDDNYVFQFRLIGDYYDSNGFQSSLRLGKSWQVRNWNLYTLGSLGYSSDRLMDSMYGISSEEATSRYPQYKPSGGFNYGVEVGAAYPISENLVFRALYRFNILSDEISDSSLSISGHFSSFSTSISYVF